MCRFAFALALPPALRAGGVCWVCDEKLSTRDPRGSGIGSAELWPLRKEGSPQDPLNKRGRRTRVCGAAGSPVTA